MKRLLTVLLVGSLLLTVSAAALGALHNSYGDFNNYAGDGHYDMFSPPSMDWYYIGTESPYWLLLGTLEPGSDGRLDGLYYKDDFTFAEFGHDNDGYDHLYLKGSYKFSNNVFASFTYCTYNDPAIVGGGIGYVFAWGENGYIAVSADFTDFGINGQKQGFGIDFRRYYEKARIYGQIYSEEGDGLLIDFGIAYQMTETFVLGGNIHMQEDEDMYSIGFTWKPSFMVLDVRYTSLDDDNNNTIEISDMFQANDNLMLGLGYESYSGATDAVLYAKGVYSFDSCDFWAQYRFGNDNPNPYPNSTQFMIGLKKNL